LFFKKKKSTKEELILNLRNKIEHEKEYREDNLEFIKKYINIIYFFKENKFGLRDVVIYEKDNEYYSSTLFQLAKSFENYTGNFFDEYHGDSLINKENMEEYKARLEAHK
jgi:hypothetical protein